VTIEGSDRYQAYYLNVFWFIENVLAAETTSMDNYVQGRWKLDTKNSYLTRAHINIEDPLSAGGASYEAELYARVTSDGPSGLIFLIGGLGSGKTTATNYLRNMIAERRAELQKRFPCNCRPCSRKPIYLDYLEIRRDAKPEGIYRKVLQGIRFAIYNALIDGLLTANGLHIKAADTADRTTLRQLLIANDVAAWADLEHPGSFPYALRSGECEIGALLLSTKFDLKTLKDLVKNYRTAAHKFEQGIIDLIRDPDEALNLTDMLIGMYLSASGCNPLSPNNLIIVDNIDQVPTETIEKLAGYLGELSDRRRNLRLLVPLRPSSITRAGFVKAPRYLSHYGPDCFEMMERRINRYILSQSRKSLSEAYRADRPTPFMNKPTSDELDVFILTTYLYALVVADGRKLAQGRDEAGRIPAAWPELHEDHEFAHGLKFSPAVVRHFAETLGAVVGTCARYATEQVRRYYDHIYSSPGLIAAVGSLRMGSKTSIRLPYGLTVTTLLGRADGDSGHNGLANLYRPTQHTGTGDWPTLAKIRILRRLKADGSCIVRDVVTALGQYGIPSDIAIDALNYLHLKERLLVWFSRNSELSLNESDLDQEVVISEHGEQYLDHVAGDFEYIWFCATRIPGSASGESPIGFKARLDEYTRLMSRVATTEWKQLSFQRAASNALWDEGSAGRSGEFVTLTLLYQSLGRAVVSASRGVLRATTPSAAAKDYQLTVEETVTTLCNAVLLHQDRFRCAFGDASYLTLEHEQIDRIRPHLAEMLTIQRMSAQCRAAVNALLLSWDANPSVALRFQEPQAVEPPTDLVTDVTRYLRGVIPGVASIVSALSGTAGGRVLLWSLIQRRNALAELLETRLPTFGIVRRGLLELQSDLEVAEQEASAARATESVAWLENELRWVRKYLAILDENKFDTLTTCRRQEMSEKKRRANNILEAFAAMAQRVGVTQVRHLTETWQ
jgi:hypothetical protein